MRSRDPRAVSGRSRHRVSRAAAAKGGPWGPSRRDGGVRAERVTMLLVRGALVVAMDPGGRLIRDGAVLIDGARIRAVGVAAEVAREPGITRVIGSDRHLVMPGLVNA